MLHYQSLISNHQPLPLFFHPNGAVVHGRGRDALPGVDNHAFTRELPFIGLFGAVQSNHLAINGLHVRDFEGDGGRVVVSRGGGAFDPSHRHGAGSDQLGAIGHHVHSNGEAHIFADGGLIVADQFRVFKKNQRANRQGLRAILGGGVVGEASKQGKTGKNQSFHIVCVVVR